MSLATFRHEMSARWCCRISCWNARGSASACCWPRSVWWNTRCSSTTSSRPPQVTDQTGDPWIYVSSWTLRLVEPFFSPASRRIHLKIWPILDPLHLFTRNSQSNPRLSPPFPTFPRHPTTLPDDYFLPSA